MSMLDLGLGFALLTVVAFSAVIISTLLAGRKNASSTVQTLTNDVADRKAAIDELRKEISALNEVSSGLRTKLAVCENDSERLKGELAESNQQVLSLKKRMSRYAVIDDAESHAAEVRQSAELDRHEIRKAAAKLKAEALSLREHVLKLKGQRDVLNAKIKQSRQFQDGCNSMDKLEIAIESRKLEYEATLAQLEADRAKKAISLDEQLQGLRREIEERKSQLDLIEDEAEMQSFGIFAPSFHFDHSDEYRAAMKECVAKQKTMVRSKEACICPMTWVVEGSEAKGRQMTDRNIKLMLRAVNGECDAIIAKVSHKNIESSTKRIGKCFGVIDRLGEVNKISFSPQYLQLKLRELNLSFGYMLAKQEEKEREREIRDAMREEEKAAKEIAKAREKAEKEEASKEDALRAAREKLAAEHGVHNAKLKELVEKLEAELSEAIDRKAKAIARAQLTKSGHVYILSNIGTMGEGIYKIGMTRRLEPHERVKELGDASVPFPFDVHAMIYSEDAPALENALHKHFHDRRVNLVNLRREYFRVTLDEVRNAVADLHGLVTFCITPDAEQYRTTLGIRNEAKLASAG